MHNMANRLLSCIKHDTFTYFRIYKMIWKRRKYPFQNFNQYRTVSSNNSGDLPIENIRNFSIIAHVDHGKSTLADRFLEITGVVTGRSQVLDTLQVERERGITVKAQTASLKYQRGGTEFVLNLIDTPGHVDFAHEVSRSLSSCQGVVLLVDANQGVQAQTVANYHLASSRNIVIIPAINKIDLKNAEPERVIKQLNTLFDIKEQDVLKVSAKFGTGVEDVLAAVIDRVPPPPVNRDAPFRALLFDSWYDKYRGAVLLVYVTDGAVIEGEEIASIHTGKSYTVKNVGLLRPQEEPTGKLIAGQVGFLTCNMRTTEEALIGDTLHHKHQTAVALPGFRPTNPMVFAGVYPMDQSQNANVRSAIEKLVLNDSAVTVAVDSSAALGHGWRLGFLGVLHMEVFSQRLEQEYGAPAVVTAPSVTYKARIKGEKNVKKYGGKEFSFSNPALFPDPSIVEEFFEPMVMGTIITPDSYLGSVMSLCMEHRGVQHNSRNIDNERVMLQFALPLNEIVVDFYTQLKSITSGYASFDYEETGFVPSKLVKLTILLNGKAVDELSTVVHVSRASLIGRRMCVRLMEIIPRQLIQIAIQATVGGKVVARETLKAYRKDVTAKLYGGDVTRRMKLLKQQAEGKKKMKLVANIEVPRETFIHVLKR